MSLSKILIGSPVYSGKKYISSYWIEKTTNISYDNYDIFVVDNSKPKERFGQIFEKNGIAVKYSPYYKNPFQRLIEARRMIHKKAIDEGYDYLLSIEQDVIVPEDIIESLLKHHVPIVGAPYVVSVHTDEKRRMIDFIISASKLDKIYDNIDGVEINEWYLAGEIINKGLLPVKSCSLGCTLIDVNVLRQIPSRFNPKIKRADDSYFFQDCLNANIPVYLDTGLLWRIDHIKRLGGELPVGKEIHKLTEN